MIEKLNKKGQTFSEFLAEYKKMDYPPNAVTVDDVVFAIRNEKPTVLLIKRGDFPYIDDWALPGGFVDEMESVKVAAVRELQEETGIKGVELEPLCTVSTPNRDPRVESISKCFFGVCSATSELKAADDASDAKWFEVDYAAIGDTYELVLKADNIVLMPL